MSRILATLVFFCTLALTAQHNGTTTGAPTFAAAKFSSGLTSTSDTKYISLPSGTFPNATTFTVEAWLKYTSNGSVQVAVSGGNTSGTNPAFWVGANSSGNAGCALVATSGFGTIDSGVSINDGAYHHVAMVVTSGSSLGLYVDGSLRASSTGSFSGLTPTTGFIGRWLNTGNSYAGGIDEVAIWNSAKYTGSTYTVPSSAYTGSESTLVSLYHLQADGTDSVGTTPTTIDPSNTAILYSPFNWNVSTGYARSVNAGAYFRVLFSGTSVKLSTDTSANSTPYSQLWARIDNQGWQQLTLSSGNPTLTVATGLSSSVKHLLDVRIKSTAETLARWSSPATIVQITGVLLDSGATVSAPIRKTKTILIYGDSITEGLRNITTAGTPDGNDNQGAYSTALLDSLDCEYGIVGFGATGISVSGQGSVPALPSSYNYIYSGVSRSFTSPAPDLILFNEGENDGTTNIVTAYTGVVNSLLTAVSTAKIGLIVPFSQREAANIASVVSGVANGRVSLISTSGYFDSTNSLDGQHPSSSEAVGRLASQLRAQVVALLYPAGRSYSYF